MPAGCPGLGAPPLAVLTDPPHLLSYTALLSVRHSAFPSAGETGRILLSPRFPKSALQGSCRDSWCIREPILLPPPPPGLDNDPHAREPRAVEQKAWAKP